MTATSNDRNTPAAGETTVSKHPIAASTTIPKGVLCMLDAGYAKNGAGATGKVCIGRSLKAYDNSTGSAGDVVGEFETGEFRWANGDSIAQADVGKTAYIADNATVDKDSTGQSPAGEIKRVDSVGVWVSTPETMGAINGASATAPSLSVSAPAAVGAAAAGSGTAASKDDHVHPITCLPIHYNHPGDAAADADLAETVFHVQPGKAVVISAINIYPSGAVTADDTDFATITIKQRTSGGSANTVATKVTNLAGTDWVAFTAESMGSITNATLAAGSQLTITIAKTASGVELPAFVVEVVAST